MGKKKEKQIIVRLICVILSFALWLYVTNVENPSRTSTLKNVPVNIINADSLELSNLALEPDQDLTVDLKLEGFANDIYSVKKDDFSLKVDLGQYVLKKGENNLQVEVEKCPEDINIKNNKTVSLRINTEEILEKEFLVESNVVTKFAPGYSEDSKIISPEKVRVSGAESQVKKIYKVVIEGEENNIIEDYTKQYKLKAVDSEGNEVSGIKINKKTAKLQMHVAKSNKVELVVKYSKTKDGVTINSVSQSKKTVKIIGDKKIIDNINSLETEEIDISNIEEDYQVEAKIKCPEGIRLAEETDTVSVHFSVTDNQIKLKTFNEVKIHYKDKNDEKYKYDLPENVGIVVKGTKEQLDKVNEDNILVEASLKDLVEGNHEITWNASIINISDAINIENSSGQIRIEIKAK